MAHIEPGPAWYITGIDGEDKKKEEPKGELPSEYFIGQEFFEDKDERKVRIVCTFPFLAEISEFRYSTGKFSVIVHQISSKLYLEIEGNISKRLRDSVFDGKSELFIINYIYQALSGLNDYLIEQRYLSGHILIRNYSIYDVQSIELTDVISEATIPFEWPSAISRFPPVIPLSTQCDKRFIRDYIDAMNSYLAGIMMNALEN